MVKSLETLLTELKELEEQLKVTDCLEWTAGTRTIRRRLKTKIALKNAQINRKMLKG